MFIAVAEAKGFSAAAAKLGVAPSTVSQAVRQLETWLGAPLFHRTTRSVALSDSGAEFLARIGPALQFLDEATETLSDANSRPTGVLRLNVPRVAYLFVWQPVLKQCIETYPGVQTEVVIDSAMVDIVAHGFDAGMRFGGSVQPGMVAVSGISCSSRQADASQRTLPASLHWLAELRILSLRASLKPSRRSPRQRRR